MEFLSIVEFLNLAVEVTTNIGTIINVVIFSDMHPKS